MFNLELKQSIIASDFILISLLLLSSLTITISNVPLQASSGQSFSNNFKTYSNIDQGISIQHPSDWIINSAGAVDCRLCIVVFDSPAINSRGYYSAEVRVGIDTSPSTRDLRSYLKNEVSAYQNNADFGGFTIIKSDTSARLSGVPALVLASKYTGPTGIEYGALQVGAFFDNKFYFVNAVADSDQFSNYYPTIEKMINSLRLVSEQSTSHTKNDMMIAISPGAGSQQVQRYYQPEITQVSEGSTITWDNRDSVTHTASADDGSFDTGSIFPGTSRSAVVQGSGVIPYHCNIHPFMTGSIQVSSTVGNYPVGGDSSSKLYTNPNYGIQIAIPSDWSQGVPLSDQPGIDFIAEFQKGHGVLRLTYYNTGDIPLETHNYQWRSAIQNNPQVKITGTGQVEISGRAGGSIAYQIPSAGMILSVFDIWIKHGNQGYLHFAFVANDPQTYDSLAPSAFNIVKSVQSQGSGDTSSTEQPVMGSEPPQCAGSPCIAADRGPAE